MYTDKNFKTKKAFREAVDKSLAGTGPKVTVFQPGPFPGKTTGSVAVEGPHYPAPHSWYASVTIADGVVVSKVK
jgi:hypothetical protein